MSKVLVSVFSVAVMSFLISGCHPNNFFTAKYEQDDILKINKPLNNGSVLIATAQDKSFMSDQNSGSGEALTSAVQSAFSIYAKDVDVSKCNDKKCMQEESKHAYCVVPEILHWEERATEWSSIPDKIQIKLVIYNGENFEPIASTSITGLSKWFTFGGDHPQDLVEDPVSDYVKSLYKK